MRAALALVLASAGALADEPPAQVASAVQPLGCASVKWSALAGGWWADCATVKVSRLDGRETLHRCLAFHRGAGGRWTMQPLAEARDSHSPRVKVPLESEP